MAFSEPIVVGVRSERGLPYSRYLMAQSLSASGLAPERAYELADAVRRRLGESAKRVIAIHELHELVIEVLVAEEGEEAARRFGDWQRLDRLDRPLVVMLAGTTGVGKSTLATMLANRLGITRVIATDVIRHVLRSFLSADFMPAVHYSAFEAAAAVEEGELGDADLVGFERQAALIGIGIAAIVERACTEGTPIVIEGVHVLPGAIDEELRRRCLLVEALVVVRDQQLHRGHFAMRPGQRPAGRYLDRFDEIRKLQEHLTRRATDAGVAVIDNTSIDGALADALAVVRESVSRLSSPAP